MLSQEIVMIYQSRNTDSQVLPTRCDARNLLVLVVVLVQSQNWIQNFPLGVGAGAHHQRIIKEHMGCWRSRRWISRAVLQEDIHQTVMLHLVRTYLIWCIFTTHHGLTLVLVLIQMVIIRVVDLAMVQQAGGILQHGQGLEQKSSGHILIEDR